MAPSAASSGLTTLPSCRLGKPSDGNPPLRLAASVNLRTAIHLPLHRGGYIMGNSFRQPYGLPPSRSVVPALLLFPRICCASAREPYILLPQSCRRCSIGQQSTFSRGRDRARSGNGTLHVPFPSSQVAKSPPGSLQESTCSPLKPTPKKYYVFFWGPRGRRL